MILFVISQVDYYTFLSSKLLQNTLFFLSRYTKRGIVNIPSEIGMRGRCWLIKSDGKTELLPEICNNVYQYRAQDSDRYNMLLTSANTILKDTLDHNVNIFTNCYFSILRLWSLLRSTSPSYSLRLTHDLDKTGAVLGSLRCTIQTSL